MPRGTLVLSYPERGKGRSGHARVRVDADSVMPPAPAGRTVWRVVLAAALRATPASSRSVKSPWPPSFEPPVDAWSPIQLPVDLPAARLADELHAQLTRLANDRDLPVLRGQARSDFQTVMRHVRARRLDGKPRAAFDIRRTGPARSGEVRRRRRRHDR